MWKKTVLPNRDIFPEFALMSSSLLKYRTAGTSPPQVPGKEIFTLPRFINPGNFDPIPT
jgi:hypothetical protein